MVTNFIPFLDGYRISKNGDIFKVEKNKDPVEIETFWNKFKYVKIDRIVYRVDELICRTYYGPICFPIEYKDEVVSNCTYENLRYKITSVDEIDNLIYLNKIGIPFKLIKGTNGEYISQNGVIYSYYDMKIRSINHASNDYCSHYFKKDGKSNNYSAHRTTYETWVGDIAPKYVIDHLDGRKWNNDISNLEMVTSAVNNQRAFSNGLKELKYDKQLVHMICRLIEKNYKIQDIYNMLGIDETDAENRAKITFLVSDITAGKYHKDVSCQYDFSNYDVKKNHFNKILDDGRKDIIENLLLQTNLSQYKIGSIVGVSRSCVESVKTKLRKRGLIA